MLGDRALHGLSFIVTCFAAVALPLYFINLVPLSEFRDWLVFFQQPEVWKQNLLNLFTRETTYSRNFSIMWAGVAELTCGDRLRCVNAVASLPQVLSVVLFFGLLVVQGVRTWIAAIFASLWALSVPMLATAAWQATILDRVGMCVSLLGLVHASRIVRARQFNVVLAAVVQLVVCFAALNSKEAYWFYPIAVAALFCAENSGGLRATLRRALIVCAPMLLYSCWFVVRYWAAHTFASGWGAHVSGGSVITNLSALVETSVGSWPAILLLLTLGVYVAVTSAQGEDSRPLRYTLWFAFVAVLAYGPVSRTVAGSAYYFAPSLAFGLGALAWLVQIALVPRARAVGALLVFSAIATQLYAHSKEAAALLWERGIQAEQFTPPQFTVESLAQLRETKRICLITDPRDPWPHLWTQADSAYALFRFANATDEDQWLRSISLTQVSALEAKASPLKCLAVAIPYPALPRNVYRWVHSGQKYVREN